MSVKQSSAAHGIEFRDVSKRYGPLPSAPMVVDHISFVVPRGTLTTILGPSGCGKTTTLRMIAGLESPTAGRIFIDGQDVTTLGPAQRNVSLVFQSYALFPHLNIWENVAFGLKREGLPKAEVKQRTDEMLSLVQLTPYAQRKPHQLSGGQQQRVALARSLAKKPKLLLLDEPLGALDKKLREQTQFELVNIIESVGVTVVMVTHDQEEAMTMASRIAIMSKGRVLQVGTPEEIYEHPRNKFVADFIGNVNLFAGKLTVDEPDRCAATTAIGEVHVGHGVSGTLNMPVSIAVRPEKIEISKTRPEHASFNLFQGKVKEIGYLGSYTTYILQARDGSKVRVTEANTTRQDLSDITWEDDVYFWWDDNAAVVLRD